MLGSSRFVLLFISACIVCRICILFCDRVLPAGPVRSGLSITAVATLEVRVGGGIDALSTLGSAAATLGSVPSSDAPSLKVTFFLIGVPKIVSSCLRAFICSLPREFFLLSNACFTSPNAFTTLSS